MNGPCKTKCAAQWTVDLLLMQNKGLQLAIGPSEQVRLSLWCVRCGPGSVIMYPRLVSAPPRTFFPLVSKDHSSRHKLGPGCSGCLFPKISDNRNKTVGITLERKVNEVNQVHGIHVHNNSQKINILTKWFAAAQKLISPAPKVIIFDRKR